MCSNLAKEVQAELMSRMKQPMRTAMRFAVYVRCLGVEPLPFRHKTHHAYAVALQQQYDGLARLVDRATLLQAKSEGRALIRQHTLPVAAGNIFPSQVNRGNKPGRFKKNSQRLMECPANFVPVRNVRDWHERSLRWHEARGINRSRQ